MLHQFDRAARYKTKIEVLFAFVKIEASAVQFRYHQWLMCNDLYPSLLLQKHGFNTNLEGLSW